MAPVAKPPPSPAAPVPLPGPGLSPPAPPTPPPPAKPGPSSITTAATPPKDTLPAPVTVPPAPAAAVSVAPDTLLGQARATLVNALFKDFGEEGTLLDHPKGQSFSLRAELGDGAVHTNHSLMVPLAQGGAMAHTADVAIEMEGGRVVYVDIVDAHSRPNDLKAGAFDALRLRRTRGHVAMLVCVRAVHGGLLPEQVEAVARDAYDYLFNVDEQNVGLGVKFAALKSEIARRISGGG